MNAAAASPEQLSYKALVTCPEGYGGDGPVLLVGWQRTSNPAGVQALTVGPPPSPPPISLRLVWTCVCYLGG